MIQLEGATKIFHSARGQVRAVDNVTLAISAGEFVALRGRSGSGKSTLLSLIGGLTLPTSGRVEVLGKHIPSLSSSERAAFREQYVGFVFQMFHLLPYLNVLENVLVAARAADRAQARETAGELLEKFGLAERLTHRPAQLSAGERQRVAMARALLNRPRLLLADEPTGNLDEESAEAVLELLSSYQQDGGTVLLATHDDQATQRAQRVVELSAGQLISPVEAGSP